MIEIKQNSSVLVPVRLSKQDGAFIPGVPVTDVVAVVKKADGTEATLTLTAADWLEATTAAFADQGTYMLRIPASATNRTGALVYAVKSPTSTVYHGAVYVAAPAVSFLGGGNTATPLIISVSAPRRNQVRVGFSEPMLMTNGSAGALNPANYTITGLTILSVAQDGEQAVILTTSNQTTGVSYTLEVQNVQDLDGNVVT